MVFKTTKQFADMQTKDNFIKMDNKNDRNS